MIRKYFRGRCLLVTGGTGFVGQALIAKILTGLGDEVERIYAIIRPRRRADGQIVEPAQRLIELYESSLFDALRSDPDRWESLKQKVIPIAIDERQADLGLSPEDRQRIVAEVDTIFNSAATVVFDEPLSVSLQANIDGPMALLELAHESAKKHGKQVHFVHVSTAYVNGQRHGVIADEELPLDRDMRQVIDGLPPGYDPIADIADCRAVCERTEQQSRSDEHIRRFKREILAQHKSLSRKLTKSRLDRLTEERRQRWVDRRLVDEGMERARVHGWNDVYTYTKAVGEQVLTLNRGSLPLVIVRPSIIESSLQEPEPGWITGLKVMDPLLAAYGRGMVPDFPARPDVILDLIPVDKVVNTTLAAATTANAEQVLVYHISTGDENPVRVHEVFEHVRGHFLAMPMIDRDGKSPKLPQWRYPSVRMFRFIFHLLYMWPIQLREWFGSRTPFYTISSRQRRFLGTAKVRLQRVLYYTDIYHPYTNLDCRFKTTSTRALFEALPADEQRAFNLDVRGIDWPHYIGKVHVAGLRRHVLREDLDRELPESPDELGAIEQRLHAEEQIHTLADLLRWSCERHAGRVALQIQRQGHLECWTYDQLVVEVGRRAGHWQRLGLAAGDRVLLQGANGPEWVQSYFAATISGLAVVPVDPQTQVDEIERLIDYVDARGLIAEPQALSAVHDSDLARIELHSGRMNDQPITDGPFDEPAIDPQMEASIIFTSGTLVDPRGVVLTHANFVADVLALAEVQPVDSTDQILSLLPLHHGLEFTGGLLMSLWGGATTSFLDGLNSRRIVETMTATGTTALIAVPRILQLLVDRLRRVAPAGAAGEGPEAEALKRLRLVVSGGAPLSGRLFDACEELGFHVHEGYGLTEAAPIVTVNPPGRPRRGSVGQALPGIEIRIDSATEIGDGGDVPLGEVLVRGGNVMAGYLGRPDITETCLADGWLHTGDLGYLDTEGYLYLEGRAKDLILTGAGKNVYPEEVEALYGDLPQVAELAVVGVPSPRTGGEEVRAVAVLNRQATQDDGEAAQAQLREQVYARARQLPTYQRIQRLHLRDRSLPRLDNGTPDRHALVAELMADPDRPAQAVGVEPWERPIYAWLHQHTGLEMAEIRALATAPLDTLLDSLMVAEFAAWLEPHVGEQQMMGLDRSQVSLADLFGRWREVLSSEDVSTELTSQMEQDSSLGATYWNQAVATPQAAGAGMGLVRRGLWSMASVPLRRYLSLRVDGLQHLPTDGPCLFAANHVSDLDAVAIQLALRSRTGNLVVAVEGPVVERQGWEVGWWSWMLGAMRLDHCERLEDGIGRLAGTLQSGKSILLFPEGRRSPSGHLRGFKSGVGLLALELNCAVIPIHVAGSLDVLPGSSRRPRRHPVHVRIGPPVMPAGFEQRPGLSTYERYRELTEAVRTQVADLGDRASD